MAARLAVGLALLLWSCDSGEGGANGGSRKSPHVEIRWDHVTEAENGSKIEANFIYYTVYLNGNPQIDVYENVFSFKIGKGCHMVYVTATRFDIDPYLESKPSEVVGVCRE